MKWVALVIALAAIGPLAGWLRHSPRLAPMVWMLMGLLPFLLAPLHLYMAVVSWATWPGFVKGLEVSILDLLALTIYLTLPRARHRLPFLLSMAFYFSATLLSVLQAEVAIAALFYPWQLARVFLVYSVVTKACADQRVVLWLLKGMAAGLSLEAGVTIWERFGLGVLQATGTFSHQNLLGLLSHLVVYPTFALLLAGQRGWQLAAAPLAGLIIVPLTASRATLGLALFGYVTLLGLSVLKLPSSRKAVVALLGAVTIAVIAPMALSSFEQRFSVAPLSNEYDERAAFVDSAIMMLSDHPMGIGVNNYVLIANVHGYNKRAGVAPTLGSLSAHVHNVYLLVAAEAGYLGAIAFVILLLRLLTVAFRCGFRNRRDRRGDLLLGCGVALLCVYIHSFFEWVFVNFEVQYVFAMVAGLIAGLARQLGYWRRGSHHSATRG